MKCMGKTPYIAFGEESERKYFVDIFEKSIRIELVFASKSKYKFRDNFLPCMRKILCPKFYFEDEKCCELVLCHSVIKMNRKFLMIFGE